MKRRWVWPLLLLASGCGPTGNSPQAVCQREALNDPAVKHLAIGQMNSGGMSPKADFAYRQAVHTAYNNCLRQHGIVVQGGVEAVQPGY